MLSPVSQSSFGLASSAASSASSSASSDDEEIREAAEIATAAQLRRAEVALGKLVEERERWRTKGRGEEWRRGRGKVLEEIMGVLGQLQVESR